MVIQKKLVWCEMIFMRSLTGEEPSIESHSKLYYTVCEENSGCVMWFNVVIVNRSVARYSVSSG